MPSGYTSDIYEGKNVNGKEFILKCARAFGATIMMRDEPLDKEIPVFEPSDYHLKAIERAKTNLEQYKNMSIEEAEKTLNEYYDNEVERINKSINERSELKTRYEKVLSEVRAWNPPTPDHVEIKKYAINQLEESINWDCNASYLKHPKKQSTEEYLKMMIESCEKDISYHTKEYQAEVERVNDRNKWVSQLKESLR